MERKTGRPKSGQERLTRDGIVAAALHIVDEQGMRALSMRRLASALKVDPMAIYRHLPGKEAVLAAMAEDVFARFRVPLDERATWVERVHAFARAYREVVRSHPNLIRHLVANADIAAPVALEANEALFGALEDAGLPPPLIVQATDLIVDYINGFALAEAAGPLGQAEDRREILEILREQPAERFPVMRRVFEATAETQLGADFEFGLDVILAGLMPAAKARAEAAPLSAPQHTDLCRPRG